LYRALTRSQEAVHEEVAASTGVPPGSFTPAAARDAGVLVQGAFQAPPGTPEHLVNRALVCGSLVAAIDVCLLHSRLADALMLAIAAGYDSELCSRSLPVWFGPLPLFIPDNGSVACVGRPEQVQRVQRCYFETVQHPTARLLHAIMEKRWLDVVQYTELGSWKDALALALSYAPPDVLPDLCLALGHRLQGQGDW
jgi:hypothetical protein